MGNGLQGTLISIRGEFESFSNTSIGLIGTFYYAGFLLGSFQCSRVVKRAGHIRAFAAFASLASVAPLIHALFTNEILWMGLRALTGYCFAGLYMIIESWLNEQATNETRGSLFSVYFVITLVAITLGQLILNLASPSEFTLFVLSSVLVSLSLLPLTLTKSIQPLPIESTSIKVFSLWQMTPVGVTGCLVVGLINGVFWILAPVFVSESGFDVKGISFFMTAVILGGAVAQYPIGYLSDRIDRRWVIIMVSMCAAIGEIALVLITGKTSDLIFYLVSFGLGMFAHSIYSVSVAQANDRVTEGDFVAISGGLLVAYSIGAVIGPLIVSAIMILVDTYVIFVYSAILHLLFALFALTTFVKIQPVPPEEKTEFVITSISITGPEPAELDPRTEELN
ncbi:MFS transporter [bacterium]|nr:MFS transporter [bacterium]